MAEPGDMIDIKRDSFSHWALYVGNGDLIHFTTTGVSSTDVISGFGARIGLSSTGKAFVKKQKLSEVALGAKWSVDNYLDTKYMPKSQDVILKEAEQQVDKEIRYDLISYNCEHFVTNLRYGQPESRQVRNVQKVVTPIASSGATGILGWLISILVRAVLKQ